MALRSIRLAPQSAAADRNGLRLRAQLAVVFAATVGVASCGGDSSSESPVASAVVSDPVESVVDTATSGPSSTEAADVTTTSVSTVAETTPPDTESPDTESPASTPPATEPPPTTEPERPCRRLADFDTGDGWVVVNDGVMGGGSSGFIDFGDSAMRFTGEVVTAGGGFTSVRLNLLGPELAGSTHLELRVRPDDRTYGVRLQDNAEARGRSVSHGVDLVIDGPADADGWQVVTVEYGDLDPSVFGQSVEAPPFDPDAATEFGLIIADGIDGPFALDVDWIDACSDSVAST